MEAKKYVHTGGIQLRDDQAAMIVNPDGSFEMVIPDLPKGQELPRDQLFIMALAMKMEVPGWYESLLDEFLQFCTDNRETIEKAMDKH